MSIVLRALRLPEDYADLAKPLNTHWSEPTAAERLEEDDAKLFEVGHTYMDQNGLLAGYDRTRQVAVTDQDAIVGYVCMYHEYTGVGRDYRGRKIALALKMKTILLAKQRNAAYIRTDNESTNSLFCGSIAV